MVQILSSGIHGATGILLVESMKKYHQNIISVGTFNQHTRLLFLKKKNIIDDKVYIKSGRQTFCQEKNNDNLLVTRSMIQGCLTFGEKNFKKM